MSTNGDGVGCGRSRILAARTARPEKPDLDGHVRNQAHADPVELHTQGDGCAGHAIGGAWSPRRSARQNALASIRRAMQAMWSGTIRGEICYNALQAAQYGRHGRMPADGTVVLISWT